MKKKPTQQPYYRTAALLGAQQQPYIGKSWTPVSARTSTRTRVSSSRARAIDASLNIPWKLVALFVLVGAMALWLLLDNRWYLMGEDIRVIGASSRETALNVAIASDLLGWHGFRLRPHAAETAIMEQVPAVTEAQVECSRFPAGCIVRVRERIPALNWITENAIYWIDAEGVLMPAHEAREGLPIVRGALPALAEGTNSRLQVAVLEGMTALAALGIDSTTDENILEYHPERGLIWTDPQGRRIAFGVGANMEARWNIYVALIAHLEARTVAGNGVFPWTIDVRFPEGPTYSLERLW